jgi:signal transduction histidine kinase/CheY-like chemotaxis protein
LIFFRRFTAPFESRGRWDFLSRPFTAPIIVFILGLVFTVAATVQLQRIIAANELERFNSAVRMRLDDIQDHIEKHIALLRGAAGLFAASEYVTRSEFAAYVGRLRLREFYPGVQGLGFTRRVEAGSLDNFLALAREQIGTGFHLWPAHPRPEYHSIIYLEPLDPRNQAAIGYDMFTEPNRREAMARARDTGRHAMSQRVELVQEIDQQKQPGFLIYLPVYDGGSTPETIEARRAQLQAFVYSPYRAGDLFNAVFGDRQNDLDIAVYDGVSSPETLLYRSRDGSADSGHVPLLSTSRSLEIGGRTWMVELASLPAFERGSGRELTPFVVAGGLLATLLLSGLAWSQAGATRAALKAREELRELNATLEHRIAEAIRVEHQRAEALRQVEEQLRQSQKMEALGQLTGGVAHDFNNLLTVIAGNLELLKRQLAGTTDARSRRNIDNAMEGVKRAALLTHRLLAFSRQSPLAPEMVDVNKLVGGMSDLLHRTLGEHVAVETMLGSNLWHAEADPNQLESAILNLAVNARDAMPEGGSLTIETANSPIDEGHAMSNREGVKPGDYVAICVSDTGVGMPPDVMARVFEPFFTTKPVGKGTGLGLAQVYGFMHQSGGHVTISSEIGHGTAVKLYLPRTKPGREPVRSSQAVASEAPVAPASGETILVIEDEPMVRQFSISALEGAGYSILAAEDGPAGLALLDLHPEVALLFTDLVLAGPLNGRKVAEEACKRRPELKVLFTTGYARDTIIHHGRLDEDVSLLAKPFTAAALVTKVQDLIDSAE